MKYILSVLLLFCLVISYSQSDSGIAYIKIKKGIITFRKVQPPEDVRTYMVIKLQNEKDGHYNVTYKTGSDAMYDLNKKKVDGPGEALFKVIGGLIVLTLAVLTIASKF